MTNILKVYAVLFVFIIWSPSNAFHQNISSSLIDEYEQNQIPKKSDSDKEFIEILSSRLLEYKKPLDFSDVPGVSRVCQRDFSHFLRALKLFELWALKMYDANGHIPIGILSGNVNSAGDFQECLSIESESLHFRGKHCIAELQPFVTESTPYLNHLRQLAQSFDMMKSTFDDPAHVFGRFSTVTHSFCVPSTCSHRDVEVAVKFFINSFTNNTGLKFDVQVNEKMCQIKETGKRRDEFERGEILTISICVVIGVLSLVSTMYDEKWGGGKDSWSTSFSVYKNWRQLTSTKRSSDDIKSIHGIRFLNAILIFLCHKSVENLVPKLNRTDMAMNSARAGSIVVRMCALYTDVFLMLSGVLVAHSLAKHLKNNRTIKTLQEIIGRYIRVMPNIIATMLVTIYIMPLFSQQQSPQRFLVIDTPAQLCKSFGWRNLLMIHNWFNFEEMCNLHTHHVGSDFELFLIAPVLVTILWKWPKRGMFLVLTLCSLSTVARFYVTYTRELMYFVPFGAKLKNLIATANHLYTLPTHRFTVYGIGLLLGLMLRKYENFKMTKLQHFIGQIANGFFLTSVIASGISMTGINVKYNPMTHSLYAAFAPIFYCLHVAWMIFKAQQGHKNGFIKFLEWKGFIITTKFCYAFYLIQIPIFQLSIANTKDIRFYTPSSMINLNELCAICLASVLMTLFIETPFNNIKKLLFKRKTIVEVSSSTEEKKEKMT